jgi:hypothetical protein
VVSHVGLNVDRHWDDFKQIDQDDQELIGGRRIALLGGTGEAEITSVKQVLPEG